MIEAVAVLVAQGATIVEDPFAGSTFAKLSPSGSYDARGHESIVYDFEEYLERLRPTDADNSIEELKELTGVDLFAPNGPLSWARDFSVAVGSLKNPDVPPDFSAFRCEDTIPKRVHGGDDEQRS